jgi:hypothetical protein
MKSRKAVVDAIRRKLDFIVEPPLRDQLLARALEEQEQSWTTQPARSKPSPRRMIMRISTTRIAVAALIGAGVVTAAAVGVKYHFVEKRPEQGYIVQSEDGRSMMNITETHATSPEQAVETAEEIALLKQQGQRELVGAGEIEVNGQLDSRLFRWKYSLADGRTITVGERDPDDHAPGTLTLEQLKEAGRLLQQKSAEALMQEAPAGSSIRFSTSDGKVGVGTADGRQALQHQIPTFERVLQGRTFTFKKYEFTLSDGTQVAWSIGTPKDNQ